LDFAAWKAEKEDLQMTRKSISTILLCAATCVARGQGVAQQSSFEVASVKPSSPTQRGGSGRIIGGPGTDDPTRITAGQITLARLVYIAYDVPFDQISGPAWLQEDKYEITAKVPRGSTKEELKLMLQRLLAERFKLAFHRKPTEFPVYELTIAPVGTKLKPTAHPNAKPARPGDYPMPPLLDADGYAVIPPGVAGMQGVPANGAVRTTYQSMPIAVVLHEIEARLGTVTGLNTWAPGRVIDKTGLTGKYDFRLEIGGVSGIGAALRPQSSSISAGPEGMLDMQDPGGGPDIFRALEKQLGLKLIRTKSILDVLVIDRAERVPTEN
jgi:uncharacterized protein (TIGR03435 family)